MSSHLLRTLPFLCGMIAAGYAHDPGLSTVEARWAGRQLTLEVAFSPADAGLLLSSTATAPRPIDSANFAEARPEFERIAAHLWRVASGAETFLPARTSVDLLSGDATRFAAVYLVPDSATTITFGALFLRRLPPAHRSYFHVNDSAGVPINKKLLSAADDRIAIAVPPDAATESTAARAPALARGSIETVAAAEPAVSLGRTFRLFVQLGIEHIWTGYDHLLFLFGLLIVCRTFRSVVAVISCFTIAHSVTLALATFDVVNLPSRLAEPAIAASIVFVGAENLVRRGAEASSRWVVTLAFGFIHGFGFASVLRDLGVGANGRGFLLPLFSFNLGVEIGQVAIAAVALPVIWWLRKSENFRLWGVPALSVIVVLAGAWWFSERVFWS